MKPPKRTHVLHDASFNTFNVNVGRAVNKYGDVLRNKPEEKRKKIAAYFIHSPRKANRLISNLRAVTYIADM
jgi:hypothetical protein